MHRDWVAEARILAIKWAYRKLTANGAVGSPIAGPHPHPIRSSTSPPGPLSAISSAGVPSAYVEQLRHGS